ncbi:MAG TPA: hypothetical protein VKB88_38460 [Bryobacteraceae bacterium]|nr:hypothetical protein [Bryobacteraceae bacterium]
MLRSALLVFLTGAGWSASYQRIVISESAHPAVKAAAGILAHKLGLPENSIQTVAKVVAPTAGDIVLESGPDAETKPLKHDGYVMVFRNGGAAIHGARPRSLLYAAGDVELWRGHAPGILVRDPDFAIRSTTIYRGARTLAEHVAEMGVNLITSGLPIMVSLRETLPEVYNQLSPQEQRRLDSQAAASREAAARFMQECHDADVTCYADLPYGNNFSRWSAPLYAAALKVYPKAKGVDAPNSWEKAALCPSDFGTWKVIDAFVKEYAQASQADGLEATFWDQFGMYCRDDRCTRDGLNQFSNEVYLTLKHYHDVLAPLGKKLLFRSWSSGAPHWLNTEWVHAPGNGGMAGRELDLWGRSIRELPAEVTIQTKVYESDCEPDARFNTLLGQAQQHTQLVEYQLTGQTTGRFYFPASVVDHMTWTIRKAKALGVEGTQVGPGGTHQTNYNLFDDILNSINVYAWRQLSWNVKEALDKIWMDWAAPIYGPEAAPHVVKALRLSEEATYRTFSPLGMGSSTNSDFAGNIARREALLRYTNRYYLPEFAQYLEPTQANIGRVVEEKAACLARIAQMMHEFELAKPHLSGEQAAELETRFRWLQEFAIVNTTLDESLWRYRYLRGLAAELTTDPEQMKFLEQAYARVREHAPTLFQYDPRQKFTCYDRPLGQLGTKPGLGNPLPLMKEIYEQSKAFVEQQAGPR